MSAEPYSPSENREMDCVDVKEAVLRGEALSWDAARHATECPVCSLVVLADDDPVQRDALFSQISGVIEKERGFRAWLRSRATPMRWFILIAASLTVVSVVGAAIPRGHFAPVPALLVIFAMVTLSSLLFYAMWLEVRPLQASEPTRSAVLSCALLGLAAPVVLALLPVPAAARFDRYAQFTELQAGFGCFMIGALTGLGIIYMVRLVDRKERMSQAGALLLATAGGVAGNLALELHCPVTSPAHLLIAHATIGIALFAGVVLYGLLPRRRAA